jgi:TrmH family RNA methyltransferase
MMPFRIVQSKQNARLKQLRRALSRGGEQARGARLTLHDGQPGRQARGLAGIEGPHLLAEALRAGVRVPAVFVAQGFEGLVETLPLGPESELLTMPRELLASALTTEAPQPVAALVEPPEWTWAHLVEARRATVPLLVVLAGLQDPGNLGTILRSAEAFGADGVIALPGTVSAWNPKAVRASAGSVFRVPLLALSEEECLTRLREASVRIWTTALRGGTPASAADLAEPIALLIGNEGNGVPPEMAAKAGGAITIPCPGPVESLNAAVAASVLLYEAARQRGIPSAASLADSMARSIR